MSSQGSAQGEAFTTEILLKQGDLEAIVSAYGASLRGLYRRRPEGCEDIITRYAGATIPDPATAGRPVQRSVEEVGRKEGGQGDVLIPFPGRIRDGHYSFQGRSFQLERNDKDGPNAIHGFVRTTPWNTDECSEASARFSTGLRAEDYADRGYPFSLAVEIAYDITDNGLRCSYAITNTGDSAAPVAAGFHPYLTVGSPLIDASELQAPMRSSLEFDGLLPTGGVLPVDGTPLDFRRMRPIGDTKLNNCFLHPERESDGLWRVRMRNPQTGRSLAVWMDGSLDYLVLYSGDPLPPESRRRSLAIEPMTCGSDAFNHPAWGLITIQPGETTSGVWGVDCE